MTHPTRPRRRVRFSVSFESPWWWLSILGPALMCVTYGTAAALEGPSATAAVLWLFACEALLAAFVWCAVRHVRAGGQSS